MLKDLANNKIDGLFVISGEKLISEIPKSYEIVAYARTPDYTTPLPAEVIGSSLMKRLTETVTPPGIIAVCRQKKYSPQEVISSSGAFVLVCEEISDPGNLGTMLRSALAFGAAGVILTKGCADLHSQKVIRASAGAFMHMPIYANADLTKLDMPIYAADPHGDYTPADVDFSKKFALVIGNEARGLSSYAKQMADCLVRIPMAGGESLNAAVAAGILMYEATQMRSVRL